MFILMYKWAYILCKVACNENQAFFTDNSKFIVFQDNSYFSKRFD